MHLFFLLIFMVYFTPARSATANPRIKKYRKNLFSVEPHDKITRRLFALLFALQRCDYGNLELRTQSLQLLRCSQMSVGMEATVDMQNLHILMCVGKRSNALGHLVILQALRRIHGSQALRWHFHRRCRGAHLRIEFILIRALGSIGMLGQPLLILRLHALRRSVVFRYVRCQRGTLAAVTGIFFSLAKFTSGA